MALIFWSVSPGHLEVLSYGAPDRAWFTYFKRSG